MADFETRPLSVYRRSEWYGMSGHSSEPGPSSSRQGHTSITSSSLSSRRRSSAASAPPSGPLPNPPIPSLPVLSEDTTSDLEEDGYGATRGSDFIDDFYASSDPPVFDHNPFQRPAPSSQLTAVAQFSQVRFAAAASVSPHSRIPNALSDSPPRSILPRLAPSQPSPPPSHPPPQAPSREIVPDRLLLSPPDPRENPPPSRPSSRRALTRALELAREAVRLDSTNDDPHGAIKAYGESVALLNEVMERVMRGEDTERRRNGRRRSIVAQEEELRRLKSIHDTYADRMNILSLIYSIPTDGQLPFTAERSRPESPSSEASRDSQPTVVNDAGDIDHRYSLEGRSQGSSHQPVPPNHSHPVPRSGSSASPYDNALDKINGIQFSGSTPSRISAIHVSKQTQNSSQLRSSNLPPRPPCPSNSPPSTPSGGESRVDPFASPPSPRLALPPSNGARPHGSSVSHGRAGSGSRLEALKEEAISSLQRPQNDHKLVNGRHAESPPLPALPSSSGSDRASSETPRGAGTSGAVTYQDGAQPSASVRPRNGSSMSDSTGNKSKQRLINDTPGMGTISQRREKNKSNTSTIAEGQVDGADGSLPSRLPMNMTSVSSGGRGRASSYPVRPSVPISGLPTDAGLRHPFQTTGQTGSSQQPRKSSLRQNAARPPLQTSFPPSAFHNPGLTLVPPPPVLPGQLPTTPISPLPPMPPSDALRRPYHLMNLLGHTMSSKSGGYITRRLHVPYEVWTQGGVLTNLPEKIRVVEVLCDALTELQNASVEFAGPMSVASGMGMGVGSITRNDGEIWVMKLEDFSVVCDNVVSNFGKKLSVGEGFVVKKSSGVGSWGGKLSRQLDKLTNGKNLDSPKLYVEGLQRLFTLTQLLDEHTMALDSQPMAPVYAALPIDVRVVLEAKLRRTSEFFATVVLTFVIRDLSQLLDKYAKKGEKWLAE